MTGGNTASTTGSSPATIRRPTVLRAVQVGIDLSVLSAAIWMGYYIRFEGSVPSDMFHSLLTLWPFVVVLEYGMLFAVGVPRYLWRYTGLREVTRILVAIGGATVVLAFVRASSGILAQALSRPPQLPYGVIAINCTLAFLAVAGVRVSRRLLAERSRATSRRSGTRQYQVPTLLIGAGQGGVSVAKELQNRPDLGIQAVGFLDDDINMRGTLVHGLPVLGTVESIVDIAPTVDAEQVLITISNAHGGVVRRISDLCSKVGLEVRFVPSIQDLVEGRTHQFGIRDVLIEDLLRRDPIHLDSEAIAFALEGRTVVVTGAGGSIGSELCRQLLVFHPKQLLLVDRAEGPLFEIHRELRDSNPAQRCLPCIADVGDTARIRELLAKYQPDVIFHAAAHKHVPMMEANPIEALKNNVLATRRLADAAHAANVGTFVMVSTDKAVRATSVMGASKRAAEMYIQAKAKHSSTEYVAVRFGNVLGSTGSVVPIFKQQIAAGGPITVTHPEMQRYFMTIPEASQLVLQAGTMGAGGEIFILDMGEPVKILDLAKDLVRLSGLNEGDIELQITGIRPGEKLFEELCSDEDEADRTVHPKILVARTQATPLESLCCQFETLAQHTVDGDAEAALRALRAIVGDFCPELQGQPIPSAASPNERGNSQPERAQTRGSLKEAHESPRPRARPAPDR